MAAVSDTLATLTRLARPFRLDVLLASGLTIAGELEVLLGPAAGSSRLVSALALPAATLPLAWRRSVPLLPLATLAVALPVQALLDGFLVEQSVTPLAALVFALYSAGRYVDGASGLAGAAFALAVLVATRIAFDPAVQDPGDAALTVVYGPLPLLVVAGCAVRPCCNASSRTRPSSSSASANATRATPQRRSGCASPPIYRRRSPTA